MLYMLYMLYMYKHLYFLSWVVSRCCNMICLGRGRATAAGHHQDNRSEATRAAGISHRPQRGVPKGHSGPIPNMMAVDVATSKICQ